MTRWDADREAEDGERLLLDPCRDDPTLELGFDRTGASIVLANSDRAQRTIRVLFLDRRDRCEHRRAYIDELSRDLRADFTHDVRPHLRATDDVNGAWLAFTDRKLERASEPQRRLAGVASSMRRDPAAFGLLEP